MSTSGAVYLLHWPLLGYLWVHERAFALYPNWAVGLGFAVVLLALSHLTWVLVERVKFPVAAGWASPTMLAFVPALFLLPTPVVPLIAVAATVLRQGPELVSGRARLRIVP